MAAIVFEFTREELFEFTREELNDLLQNKVIFEIKRRPNGEKIQYEFRLSESEN